MHHLGSTLVWEGLLGAQCINAAFLLHTAHAIQQRSPVLALLPSMDPN